MFWLMTADVIKASLHALQHYYFKIYTSHLQSTVLTPSSVCRLSVTLCIMAKRCVLGQKLLMTGHRIGRIWEIDRYQNEWPSPLFKSRLMSPLRHIRHWISQKLLEIEASFQRTTNRNGLWGIKWSLTDDVTLPWKVKLVTPIRLELNISKTAGDAI